MGILGFLGAVTLVVGLVLVVMQFYREWNRVSTSAKQPQFGQMRGMGINAGPVKMNLKTTYIGAVIAGLGAVLLLVGALTGK
jgi:hypothetical protein